MSEDLDIQVRYVLGVSHASIRVGVENAEQLNGFFVRDNDLVVFEEIENIRRSELAGFRLVESAECGLRLEVALLGEHLSDHFSFLLALGD